MYKLGLVLLLFGLAAPVLAEREVHVVAVGRGHQTDNYYALPEARVRVDRPGHDISLVLLDGGVLHWQIETTAGTIISDIIRSGPSAQDSKVSLTGIPMVGVQVTGLPLVYRPSGRKFRGLVDAVADRFGTDHISSFQAAHKANQHPLTVDHIDTTTAALARNYLPQFLRGYDDLSPDIRTWIDTDDDDTEFDVAFDAGGITLTGPSGPRRFPVTPDVPEILLPVAGVYDPTSQVIYCITIGAEGYLYSVDVRTGVWTVVTSLDEYDAAGLLYDADTRQLVLTGAFSRPGDIRVFGLDGHRASAFIPITGFPGLTDLFDYGNEHGPPLIPRVFSDGWLLIEARVGDDGPDRASAQYRLYALQIATGEVRLLRFGTG
ncbi:hypothetical protein [Antarctobacter heliothermus]|uniref:hypothetical protein n=1 Tax=Antarctobacter heliothermus TaxID=74033 RepID=UPI0020C830AE|nr:hypothetical protein [Antarctobacter heliothermus]